MGTELTFINKNAELPALNIENHPDGAMVALGDEKIFLQDKLHPITLVQPGKLNEEREKYADHKGKFYNEIMDMSFEELYLLPIGEIRRGRSWFGAYNKSGNNEVLCYSINGEVPSAKIDDPPSQRCGEYSFVKGEPKFTAECPKAQWGEDKTPPECGEIIVVAFLDITFAIPVVMTFKGTGIPAYNSLRVQYRNKELTMKALARAKNNTRSMNDFMVKFTIKDEGNYVKPECRIINATDENPGQYTPLIYYYYENLVVPEINRMHEIEASPDKVMQASDFDVNAQSADATAEDTVDVSEAEADGKEFDL